MNDFYQNLKTLVLGTKTSELDRDIDSSLQSIEILSSKLSNNKYIDILKNLISTTGANINKDLSKGMQNQQQVQMFDQTGRLSRYQEYDAILNKISYCQRALITLVDHIISPDEITKASLIFTPDAEVNKQSISIVLARLKKIEQKLLFDDKLKKVIMNTLKKGDYFTEILYSPRGEHALTILNEGVEVNSDNIDFKIINHVDEIDLSSVINENKTEDGDESDEKPNHKLKVVIEYSPFGGVLTGMGSDTFGANITSGGPAGRAITYKTNECPPSRSKDQRQTKPDKDPEFKSKYDEEISKKEDDKIVKLRDFYLTFHNPKHVIRLETERFRSCLGYLVFPKVDPATAAATSTMSFTQNNTDQICLNIINKLHDTLKTSNDKVLISDDLKKTIMDYLKILKNNEDLKIRYVPPELMIHWRINTDKFDPYGESIFECVNFDCKLLMALKTANTIKKLSGAIDKRVVYVETGLPRDAKNIIEAMKENLNKRKISIGSMGSIDTIPSQIATFETVYIPMRDGKKFVEIEKQEWGQDANQDTESLKFIRDNIVANLGVPAPYLGLEDNISNKSILSTENINFCRTLISYQKELSVFLKETFEKIYKLLFKNDETIDLLDKIGITFQEPKISPYEHEMEYVEQMQRLIEALKALDVPVKWLKKKYLPTIDWDEIDKFKAEDTIEQELSESPPDDQMGVGGTGAMY